MYGILRNLTLFGIGFADLMKFSGLICYGAWTNS